MGLAGFINEIFRKFPRVEFITISRHGLACECRIHPRVYQIVHGEKWEVDELVDGAEGVYQVSAVRQNADWIQSAMRGRKRTDSGEME